MSLRSGGGERRKGSGSGASNQVRVEDREGGGAPGPGPGGRRKRAGSCPEVGVCIWVCRAAVGEGAAHPGVLREGPTRGRVPQLDAAGGQEGGRSPGSLRWGGGKWLSAPGAGCGGDRARRPQCRAAGLPCGARAQSRSSTYLRGWKWAGMGRNTVPEVKPPTPSPGAGDVPEGNHSPLYRPPFPLPKRFPSLAPPPLSSPPPQSVGGREPCITWATVSPPTTVRWGGAEGGAEGRAWRTGRGCG